MQWKTYSFLYIGFALVFLYFQIFQFSNASYPRSTYILWVLISIGSSILTKPNSCLVVALWGNIIFIVINSTRIFPENTVTAPCYMFTLLTSVIVRYNFQMQVNKNEYLTIITSAKSILQFDLLPPWRKNVTYILSSTKLKPISY